MTAPEFKQQFLPLSRRMYWTAWRLTGHAQEAEDLVQEAFLRLWSKKDTIGVIENAEAYCTALVKNLYYNQSRRKRVYTSDLSMASSVIADTERVDETVAWRDESCQVRRLINQLPLQQRKVVMLHDVEELTNDEIQQQTGLQPTNIRVLLSRARNTIREKLKIMSMP